MVGEPTKNFEAIVEDRKRKISRQEQDLRDALQALTASYEEQKRLNKELQERVELQDYLVGVADSLPGTIAIWLSRPDGTASMPYASPNLKKIFDLDPAEVKEDASLLLQRVHPDDLDGLLRSAVVATQTMTDWHHQYRVNHPLKGEIWVEGRSIPKKAADGAIVFHGFLHDVTERHSMEMAIRQTQKMESLGLLTGGLAHDFANILGIISTNLQLIEHRPTAENLTDGLKVAMAAIDRGTKLIRRLQALSQRQSMGTSVCDARQEIEKVRLLVAQTLPSNITLAITAAEDIWPIQVDPGEFGDALINLLINSTQAMPGGGQLTIRAANVGIAEQVGDRPPGDYLMVEVQDSGAGIPQDLLERVFEPFFSTKKLSGGTGLGLAMVYAFARRYGGGATIESTFGAGTTVRLHLPRSIADTRSPPTDAGKLSSGAGETILIVDDEGGILEAVARHLTAIGYRALAAANAQTALEILAGEDKVALLFSDIVMPGKTDGIALARQARDLRPDILVLLTSGFSDDVHPRRSEACGFEVLPKPYRMEELSRRIRRLLDRATAGQSPGTRM